MNHPSSRPANNQFASLLTLHPDAFAPPPVARALDGPKGRWSFVRWLLERIERWAWNARQRDLERALASATDLTEVERRLRAYERGVLHRYY